MRVGDPDPCGDREQLLGLGDARERRMDGKRRCPPPGAPRSTPDRGRVEAQLGRHVARERGLRAERLEQRPVGDERVALRVAGDADLAERMADLGHLAQQRSPSG